MSCIRFTKTATKADLVQFIDSGRVLASIDNPKQGILPHDFFHVIVEKHFGIKGFTDLVFEGHKPEFAMKADGEAWLSESMVEAIQGMLWSGSLEQDQFNNWVKSICEQRSVPTFAATEMQFAELKNALEDSWNKWKNLPVGDSLDFEWSE